MSERGTSPYVVTITLPRQKIEVRARDTEDAVFRAWHMLGAAGLAHYGTVTAEPQRR